MLRLLSLLFICIITTFSTAIAAGSKNIPILCYHNLSPTSRNSMTMTPAKFESQIKWILDHGYNIIPLKDAVAYLQGKRDSLPEKSIVITVDDGWHSVYKYMQPIIRKYNIPVTLFIFPQAISVGNNYMTWNELKELQDTGLFDIQSHTYSHPNFKKAKRSMSEGKYAAYVKSQMEKSKEVLERKLGVNVTLLAWPFGIYNAYLEQQAQDAGYQMAFTIDYKAANRSYRPEAQPRFMIIDKLSQKTFEGIVRQASP